jgi:hypothetical protein
LPRAWRPGLSGLRLEPSIACTPIHLPSGEIATPSGSDGTVMCWTVRNGACDTSTSVTASASPESLPAYDGSPANPTSLTTAHLPSLDTSIVDGDALFIAQRHQRVPAVVREAHASEALLRDLERVQRRHVIPLDAEHHHAAVDAGNEREAPAPVDGNALRMAAEIKPYDRWRRRLQIDHLQE